MNFLNKNQLLFLLNLFFITHHLITLSLSLNPKIQYYGDVSFKSEYLPQMCSNLTSKYVFFYVENLVIKNATYFQQPQNNENSTESSISPIKAYLQQLNCPHEYYSDIAIHDIVYTFLSDETLKYRRFLVIFDFTSQPHLTSSKSSEQFNKIMSVLSNLFIFCLDCFPYTLLFSHSEHIRTLLEDNIPEVATKFQASVVGMKDDYQSVSVMHMRPILDGELVYYCF